MKRYSLLLTAGAIVVAGIAGCQAIAGITTRTTDPLLTGCSLPTTGNGRVRLVNVAAVAGNTDFCIKPSGTSSWGRPIFRDGGNDGLCLGTTAQPGGLAYTQATVPFAVPDGKIDVKAIPAGQTCAAKATSETDGVTVGDSTKGAAVMTLIRYGGGSTTEAISALPELAPGALPQTDTAFRIVNAMSTTRSVDWGFSQASALPATIDQLVDQATSPIPPGATTPGSTKSSLLTIDPPSGYAGLLPQLFHMGVAYADDPSNTAITLFQLPFNVITGTFYAIGDPTDPHNLHPATGLFCLDKVSVSGSGTFDAGVGDAGLTAEDTQILQQCTLAPLPLLSVDVVNVSLYGAEAPFESQRKLQLFKDIPARTSDFLCMLEVDRLGDKQTFITNAAAAQSNGAPGHYPYSFMVTTDESTPPSNPIDVQQGGSTEPCGSGAVDPTNVQKVYTCVENNCSTTGGGDPNGQGTLNGTAQCLSASCTLPFAKFYSPLTSSSTPQEIANDACFDCMVYYLTDDSTIATGETNCTTQSSPPLAFGGQMPPMILSHYPINQSTSTSYVLPATGYRRGVLKAQITLENNQVVDFFCGELSSPLIDSLIPYTGAYGSDFSDGGTTNGWEEEQDKQAAEAIAWIQSEIAKDKVPAIVAMDLHSDDPSNAADFEDGGLTSISPEVVDMFVAPTAGLKPAVPTAPTVFCDYCPAPTNVYNEGTPPYEFIHTFTVGFPNNATQSETLWGTDNSEVTIPPGLPDQPQPDMQGTGPILEYYAHNYTILRP